MAKPRSHEERRRGVDAANAGTATITEVAATVGTTRKTIHAWLRAAREAAGEVPPPKSAGRPRASAIHRDAIVQLAELVRDAPPASCTTALLASLLTNLGGPAYRDTTMIRKLREWGFTSRRDDSNDQVPNLLWTAPTVLTFLKASDGNQVPAWLTSTEVAGIAEYAGRRAQRGFTIGMLLSQRPELATLMSKKRATQAMLEAYLVMCGYELRNDRWFAMREADRAGA